MNTNRLLSTVAALGSVKAHISGGYQFPQTTIPIMKSSKPSKLYDQ